ncbi:MAG: hypothetical protein DRI93_07270 [Aquificota bacterium]|nr:MAG: hypothetical protein DRI93_07270 [Aquificota bacterium]
MVKIREKIEDVKSEENYLEGVRGLFVSDTTLDILEKKELIQAYGKFLLDLDKYLSFDWYATLTFRDWVHPEVANKAYMRWIHRLNRHIFGVRYTRRGQGVYWVRALEKQKRQVIHFHALIGGIPERWDPEKKDLRRLHWMDDWYEHEGGFARIYPYDRRLGATFYLGKYIGKGGELDYSDNIVAVVERQRLQT